MIGQKNCQKMHQKIRQNSSYETISIVHNKKQKETERNRKEQKQISTNDLHLVYQSRFLEAPLVRQADTEVRIQL